MFSLVVFSQNKENEFQDLAPEKIYLQLDSNVYTTSDNIWFKSIVVHAETHNPSQLSRVLYVELIGPDEKVLEQKLVNINNGLGNNFFKLYKNYPQGRYLIRAYTEWNKNFGTDFLFKTYVNIFTSSARENKDPIKELTFVKNEEGKDWVNIEIDPLQIDSLQKKKLSIYLLHNSVSDSLIVKKSNSKNYKFSYEVPKNTNLITLTIETENKIKFTKAVSLNNELLDVQFFPEGGELLYGLMNKVGFKVLNYKGKGITIEGDIIDEAGKKITKFKSNQFGMGVFAFKPTPENTYFARVKNPSGDGSYVQYPLPEAVSKGSLLSIFDANEKIRISAFSNELKSEYIFIQILCRGIVYFEIKGALKNGWLITDLEKKDLPEGIIAFTLVDKNRQPQAERLYFNELTDTRLDINLSSNIKSYKQREKTTLDIKILGNERDSIRSNFSVLVLNKELLGKALTSRQNILSYLLLNSELKGEIENPNYYFNKKNSARKFDLDVLMLTQGWRKYKYSTPMTNDFSFKNEPALSVNGRIGVPFSKIKKEGMDLTMAVFGKNPSFYSQKTDSLGYFDFQIADEYGASTKILVQNNDKLGKKKNYPILLSKKEPLKIEFNQELAIEELDAVVQKVVQRKRENKRIVGAFDTMYGVTQLDEVTVEARKLTPLQQKVTKKYGEADVVINGEEIASKEEKWSYGLYSVLLFNYPHEIEIETFSDGFMLAHVVGGRNEATLIMIDGKLVRDYNYNLIPSLPPSEIKSVELIKYAKRFVESYVTVFPNVHPLDAPKLGHIISIYTHGNVGLHAVDKPKGQFHTSIPVFSAEKDYYIPKYDTPAQRISNEPDLRSLVYWNPDVNVVGTKKAAVEFYNGDDLGEMLVIVEAISEDGQIGYKEFTYEVKEGP
tara:strand:+ start:2055 stop:4736 length:2682 start_codon:yes stop_codon:yes gene_type:complete